MAETRNPFPGPRPYGMEQHEYFFGRGMDIRAILERLYSQRLTVLAGESASGKTSLVRAGLTPKLWELHTTREGETSGGLGPVLVLRDWSVLQDNIESCLWSNLRLAIREAEYWSKESSQTLGEIYAQRKDSDSFNSVLIHMCRQMGGLVVIFDQLEEVYRRKGRISKEITVLLTELSRASRRLKLLLSLRSEHFTDLRSLDGLFGDLSRQTYFLPRMEVPTVSDAVQSAAKRRGCRLSSGAMDELLRALHLGEESGENELDLLTLQAVLRELYDAWETGIFGSNIDELLVIHLEKLSENLCFGGDIHAMAGGALSRWIEKALTGEAEPQQKVKHDPLGYAELQGNERELLQKHVGCRIARFMSSGGFKVNQAEDSLFESAFQAELITLRSEESEAETLSGIARRFWINENSRWDKASARKLLKDAFRETLTTLHKANILKLSAGKSDSRFWELIHDGLGDPFEDWAKAHMDSWDDRRVSLCVSRGVSPISVGSPKVRKGDVLANALWKGCVVTGLSTDLEGQQENAQLSHVTFTACDLSGTIFTACMFDDAEFLGCVLRGTIFIECQFVSSCPEEKVRFKDCLDAASRGFFRCSFDGVTFENCGLSQITFKNAMLMKDVEILDSDVYMGSFRGLERSEPSSGASLIFGERTDVQYTSWGPESEDLVKISESLRETNGVLDIEPQPDHRPGDGS